jgi:hypothetical protein
LSDKKEILNIFRANSDLKGGNYKKHKAISWLGWTYWFNIELFTLFCFASKINYPLITGKPVISSVPLLFFGSMWRPAILSQKGMQDLLQSGGRRRIHCEWVRKRCIEPEREIRLHNCRQPEGSTETNADKLRAQEESLSKALVVSFLFLLSPNLG